MCWSFVGMLTERGLEPALESPAGRAAVPVTLNVPRGDRLPEPVESAAYFVASEALADVPKYSRASRATVTLARGAGHVIVEVADDGVGGADAGRGTRLRAQIPVRRFRRDD